MRAAILAAGIGRRLGQADPIPKVLLSFDGESLLQRHVTILKACGIRQIDLAVGHRSELIEQEILRIGAADLVTTHYNRDYLRGSMVSLATLQPVFEAGEAVIFMDGDVLYDQRLMARLVNSRHDNCFLLDKTTEEGEDPVKLCLRDGQLVDFHKIPKNAYDWWGEWVGFARFAPGTAARIAAAAAGYVGAGRHDEIYEDAFRDVLLSEPPGSFGLEDITGLPWVEIDFPEDLARARQEIFPQLASAERVS